MSFNPENTAVMKSRSGGGSLYVGLTADATLPTSATTAVPEAQFRNCGIISADADTLRNSKSVETKRDRNGNMFRTISSEFDKGVELAFEEWTPENFEFLFGEDTVTVGEDGEWEFNAEDVDAPVRPVVLDYVDVAKRKYYRFVSPAAQVIAAGESIVLTGTDTTPIQANVQFLTPAGGGAPYRLFVAPIPDEGDPIDPEA